MSYSMNSESNINEEQIAPFINCQILSMLNLFILISTKQFYFFNNNRSDFICEIML